MMKTTTTTMFLSVLLLSGAILSSSVRKRRNDDVTLESLMSTMQQQSAVIQTLQADLTATKSDLAATKSELAVTKTSVQSLQSTLQAQQAKLEQASKIVAFTARISAHDDTTDGIPMTNHQTIIFDNAMTNKGQAYNTQSGIFTAPVAGVYVFYVNVMSPNHPGYDVRLNLMKNGAELASVYARADNFDEGSTEITVNLVSGDQVWVRQAEGHALRGSQWTVFTGFLLRNE